MSRPSHAAIEQAAIGRKDAVAFWQTYYRPRNASKTGPWFTGYEGHSLGLALDEQKSRRKDGHATRIAVTFYDSLNGDDLTPMAAYLRLGLA